MPTKRDELKALARRRADQDQRNEEAAQAFTPQEELHGMSALEQAEYFASRQVTPTSGTKQAPGPDENKARTTKRKGKA
jgi:hypothetical protein